ncbi:MAG: YkuS family protein [Clostridia bacterium]|nr:YkuS family protein [Clostridia bacterium]
MSRATGKPVVAVDEDLAPVRQELEAQGFDVVGIGEAPWEQVSAVVVSGSANNLAQMEDIHTKAPVIDARGKTAQEIARDLQELR